MKVYSLTEAMEWFVAHSEGAVTCVFGEIQVTVDTYPNAKKFYEGKYRYEHINDYVGGEWMVRELATGKVGPASSFTGVSTDNTLSQ